MPLALVSSDPADLATGVSVEQIVTLTFDDNVRVDSATTATVMLFRGDTDFPLEAKVVASGNKVVLLPAQALHQDASYTIRVIGSSEGLGYALQDAGGAYLATSFELTFRTGTERFVSLSEVADRTDIERIGPIRESDPLAIPTTAGPLEIIDQDPEPFACGVSIDTTAITICFDRDLDPTTVNATTAKAIQLPVLGLVEYYGIENTGADGLPNPRLLTQLGECDDATPPTLTPTVQGSKLIFVREAMKKFFFNTEVKIQLTTGIKALVGGDSLLANTEYVFTTEYIPMYASPQLVELDMGMAVATIETDTICRLLHRNSIEVWEMMGRSIPLACPDPNVRRYVLCQTILNILNVLLLNGDLRAGETKTLGDLTIRKQPSDPMLGGLYRTAVECLANNKLTYKDSFLAKATVKGSNAPGLRMDHRLRTWDHLLVQAFPAANLSYERFEKQRLSAGYASAGKDLAFTRKFFLSVNASRIATSGVLF